MSSIITLKRVIQEGIGLIAGDGKRDTSGELMPLL
jgi:hypothetical protein